MIKREWYLVPIGFVAGLLIAGLILITSMPPQGKPIYLEPFPTDQPDTVFIVGAVKNPGTYSLLRDSRVQDLLDAAGGFAEDANETAVNLAAKIHDGEKVTIPFKDEDLSKIITIVKDSNETELLININSATQKELEQLSGIGPGKASDIIEYREVNGDFVYIEDIQNVTGIGPATFEKLKESITVEYVP